MISLNEPIARLANREDSCTGRFWESRSKRQTLLDDAAVLTSMSYVDLNPIRASIADNLDSSSHTSAPIRINHIKANADAAKDQLSPVNSSELLDLHTISPEDYIDLIDWTTRLTRSDKHDKITVTETQTCVRSD